MVTTIDGRAAIEGSSRRLGGDGDLAMLVALRAWAQALIVGPGTVKAEGYGKIRADLPVIVVSRSGQVPREAPLFSAADQPVEVSGAQPRELIDSLRRRGLRRILCEGGPRLNRALVDAGVIDELFLTLTPLLAGDDTQPRIVSGAAFPEPRRASLLWTLEAGGDLFLRYALTEKTH
jgi:riboflavin biosynthesis pyrimidine reductase